VTALVVDDGRYRYGERIVDGELRYESPSGLDLADTRNDGGCLRKWFYRYVMRIREPDTAAKDLGTKSHAQIEHYLKTGEDVLGPIPRRGLHMIPEPGPDLIIEWAVAPPGPSWKPGELVDPRGSYVHIEGVPIIGYLDLAHGRGVNKGADDITDTHDPAGTIEVLDHKFTRDPGKWAKTHDQVAKATPMLIYGRGVANACAVTPEHVRLSHCYYGTEKREAFKRSRRVALPVIDERLVGVAAVMRAVKDAARETDPVKVPGNTRACSAFKGCIHLPYCSAGQRGSLERLFGPAPKEDPSMSVLDIMKQIPGLMPAAPAPVVAPPPAPAAVAVPLGFAEAWADIVDAGLGAPTLADEAAKVKAAFSGVTLEGSGYAGSGAIAAVTCRTVKDVFDVALNLQPHAEAARAAKAAAAVPVYAAERAAVAPTPPPAPFAGVSAPGATIPAILPPDAPPSNPALAAVPVQPTAAELASGTFPQGALAAMAALQAATAPAAPVETVSVATPMPPMPVADAPAEPKKRGRKPKAETTAAAAPSATPSNATGVTIYVNCIPSVPYESMQPWIDELAKTLLSSPHAQGATDLRLVTGDALGFGKWKPYLEALAREAFDKGSLPAGDYVVERGDIADVVVAGLRGKVDNVVKGLA